MPNAAILDLGLHQQVALPPRPRWHPLTVRGAAFALVLLAVAALIGPRAFALFGKANAESAAMIRVPIDRQRDVLAMNVDDKAQILAEGEIAQQQNAIIPISNLPVEAGRAFNSSSMNGNTLNTALTCLTQAVYYEAANEPIAGRRAVAQVVLNRVRHPAYPKSVCGVVYEGASRMTGCQFSFTCDGALLRAPMQRQWHEAQEVARMALAGNVERSVGSATHYHADYVLPKWAFTLAKIEQIGRHIFYRFTGSWGSSLALNGRYSGVEQIPHLDFAALRLRAAEHHDYAEQIEPVPGLTVPPEVTDRHAVNDVGGRLDMTKTWRLSIPDPVAASSQYRKALGEAAAPAGSSPGIAAADSAKPGLQP